jgi:hypothetical protein
VGQTKIRHEGAAKRLAVTLMVAEGTAPALTLAVGVTGVPVALVLRVLLAGSAKMAQ